MYYWVSTYFLHKTSNLVISRRCRGDNDKEMYQNKNARAGRAESLILLIKPIICGVSGSRRRRSRLFETLAVPSSPTLIACELAFQFFIAG